MKNYFWIDFCLKQFYYLKIIKYLVNLIFVDFKQS